MTHHTLLRTVGAAALLSLSAGLAAQAQTIITTSNGIIRSSLCVGTDCQSGISFSDSTIIVKENNTRIKFADTSSINSFPRNDWELEANSQTNGGPNRFSLLDCGEGSNNGGCTESINVFSVEANAGANALYVDDGGRVGFGTGSPVVELHVVDGDTPTLRLEQTNANGFTPQTFDVAGNETNFFVRDVTNGSTLPLRIRPGAPSSAIDIAANGDVGIGTSSPQEDIHIRNTGASENAEIRLEAAGHAGAGNGVWELIARGSDGEFAINDQVATGAEFIFSGPNAPTPGLNVTGTVTASVAVVVGGTTLNVPDYVFAPDYQLMPLAELETFIATNSHLPKIPSAAQVKAGGLNMTEMQLAMLEKIEELTLYTLEQQKLIEELQQERRAQ